MPAVSQKQQRFFGYLKSNPLAAKARGISAKVVDEFSHAPGGSTAGLPKVANVRPRGQNIHIQKPVSIHLHFGSFAPKV